MLPLRQRHGYESPRILRPEGRDNFDRRLLERYPYHAPLGRRTSFVTRYPARMGWAKESRAFGPTRQRQRQSKLLREKLTHFFRQGWILLHSCARKFVSATSQILPQYSKIGFLVCYRQQADAAHFVLRFLAPGHPHGGIGGAARVLR